MRPYADRMLELMIGTARASTSIRGLPLLQRREPARIALLPLTGDRGLAGAFNAQILRHSVALERSPDDLGRVAEALAISPTTLWRKMKRLGLRSGSADEPTPAMSQLLLTYTAGGLPVSSVA